MENAPEREPEETSERESLRTNVLLEKLRAEFRTFGEDLSFVRKRVDSTFEEVGRHTERLDHIDLRLTSIEGRLTSVEVRLTSVEGRLTSIEGRLDTFDRRLNTVESKVGL